MPSPEDSRFDTEIPQVIAGKYNVKVERQMAETNEGKLLGWCLILLGSS